MSPALAAAIVLVLMLAGCVSQREAQPPRGLGPENSLAPLARRVADRLFIEGSVLQMEGHYGDAIVRYDRAMRLAPRLAPVRYALACCYRESGRSDSALLRAGEAVLFDPDHIDARMLLAQLLIAAGRTAEAVNEYEEVVRRKPDHVQARYNAARLIVRTDPAHAIEHYEYIRTNITSDYNTLSNLAEIYTTQHRPEAAARVLEELLILSPNDIDLHTLLVSSYLLAGRYTDAVRVIDLVERAAPSDSVYVAFVLARARPIVRGQVPVTEPNIAAYAAALADRLQKAPRGRDGSWTAAGLLRFRLGDIAAADDLLAAALVLPTATEDEWLDAASMYVDNGHGGRALRFLEPTARRVAGNARAMYLLACATLFADHLDEAERRFKAALALDDLNGPAWAYLGAINLRKGAGAGCEHAYQRAYELEPDDAALLNNYAYALATFDRRLEFATTLIDRALAEEPENELYLDTKGWVLFHRKRYEEALQYIQRSVDAGGASAEVLMHLGDANAALGNVVQARDAYQSALRLDPANESIRRKLQALAPPSGVPR